MLSAFERTLDVLVGKGAVLRLGSGTIVPVAVIPSGSTAVAMMTPPSSVPPIRSGLISETIGANRRAMRRSTCGSAKSRNLSM